MNDIATMTGFSIKTVSRVINNSPNVRPETRRTILKAIEESHFSINLMARGLKTNSTQTIILFVDKHGGNYWNAWHSIIIMEIISDFKQRGYKIILSPSSGKGIIGDETDGFVLLKSGMADGAVLFDNVRDDIRIRYLRENRIPFVIAGQDLDNNDTSFVDLDNQRVGRLGAEHLIDNGYSNITFLLGGDTFYVNKNRARGFEEVCRNEGVDYAIKFDSTSLEETYRAAKTTLMERETDAFFVSGDEKVPAVYKAINEKGKKIPGDIGVLGIDNIPQSHFLSPGLSSIDQNIPKFARKMVNYLVELIHAKEKKVMGEFIKPELIMRESTNKGKQDL